ncbi:PhoH family protein [Ideonella livida]|uniref:AAA family ATPase n=1 Tax=Ideonella livida TaxID=2707176 RepID=A0A7C9PFH1_9BURK|nr:PhoH family protein [Ideonella livida]NDY90616.1 AAA family ATPase [Ideonella livida]
MPLPKPPKARADQVAPASATPASLEATSPATQAAPPARRKSQGASAQAPRGGSNPTPKPSRKTPARAPTSPVTSPATAAPAPTALPQPPAEVSTAKAPAPSPQEARATKPTRPAPAAKTGAKSAAKVATAPLANKLFVLDTNVLMHDPMSLYRFDEHDIYLPMITLEELDGHKKGMSEVARNVRQVSRELDALAADSSLDPADGIPLAKTGHKEATGKLFFQTQFLNAPLPAGLPQGKADNQILGVVQSLKLQQSGREVVLVSKDINMRVKARALGLAAEDYFNDKTLDDGDLLYTGVQALPSDFWKRNGKTIESWSTAGATHYRVSGPTVPSLLVNEFVYLENPGEAPLYARVAEVSGRSAVLRTIRDYGHAKNSVWGVVARNREQNFALNLLMDPDCDFVTLTGTAGTGKTLMTLAAGLSQVMDERRYTEIIVTRVTVPVGEDIGFLPGNEEEKMGPWMGALDDNLEVLAKGDGHGGEWARAATNDLVRSKIRIKSLNFMRGRTFLNKFVIIDEAQNLTPKQMKTLITRAGPGTKIVCLGNLAQIDTPYLTEGSSGLTYAVDRFKGWPHSGHVTLARGERSRLADYASDVL